MGTLGIFLRSKPQMDKSKQDEHSSQHCLPPYSYSCPCPLVLTPLVHFWISLQTNTPPADSQASMESQPLWYDLCYHPRDYSPLHLGIYPNIGGNLSYKAEGLRKGEVALFFFDYSNQKDLTNIPK